MDELTVCHPNFFALKACSLTLTPRQRIRPAHDAKMIDFLLAFVISAGEEYQCLDCWTSAQVAGVEDGMVEWKDSDNAAMINLRIQA